METNRVLIHGDPNTVDPVIDFLGVSVCEGIRPIDRDIKMDLAHPFSLWQLTNRNSKRVIHIYNFFEFDRIAKRGIHLPLEFARVWTIQSTFSTSSSPAF
jgi:hypothetical protein